MMLQPANRQVLEEKTQEFSKEGASIGGLRFYNFFVFLNVMAFGTFSWYNPWKFAVCRINFKQYDESAKPESEVLKALQEQDSYQPGVAGMAALQEDRKAQRTSNFILAQKFFLPYSIQHTHIFGFTLYKIDTPPSNLCFYFSFVFWPKLLERRSHLSFKKGIYYFECCDLLDIGV